MHTAVLLCFVRLHAAVCMSLPSASAFVSTAGALQQSAAGSSCAACRAPELAALFGLSASLSVTARSSAASERLTAAGVFGTALHKLQQAEAALTPLRQQAEAQHERELRSQRHHLLALRRTCGAVLPSTAAGPTTGSIGPSCPPAFPASSTVAALRLLQSDCRQRSARINQLRATEQR